MGEKQSKEVKVKSVSLTVYPWPRSNGKTSWRFAWYDQEGKRRYTTRADKTAAIKAARDKAREIHNGTLDLGSLTEGEARLCRAFLELNPDWALIDRLRAEMDREQITVKDAFDRFIASKEANAGNSPHNVRTLRNRAGSLLRPFGSSVVGSLTVGQLDDWLAGEDWAPRTKKNVRAAIITFFRWARLQGILPDRTTEAEKMARPIVERAAPTTFTPSELSVMLGAVRSEFLPWLAISAWAGVRNEELYPSRNSKKAALAWEDVDLEGNVIIVPRAVSKTNQRRIVPITGRLRAVLEAHKGKGRITGARSASDRKHGDLAETLHLGALVGGWRNNALRHSFVSYRCALVGPGQAALEAGNTETETRRSYLDAMTKEQARKWFDAEPVRNTSSKQITSPLTKGL